MEHCEEYTTFIKEISEIKTRMTAIETKHNELRAAVDILLQLKGSFDSADPEKKAQLKVLFEKADKSYERLHNLEGEYGLLQLTVEGLEDTKSEWITEKMVKEMLKSYDVWIRIGLGGIGIGIITSVAKLLGWI